MPADVMPYHPLVKIQSLTLVCLWKSEVAHWKHNPSCDYPRGQTNDYFSGERQWQSCPGSSKSSPAAQRASNSYYIPQRDAYVALQGDINASASNMQLVHLPNYPPPRPSFLLRPSRVFQWLSWRHASDQARLTKPDTLDIDIHGDHAGHLGP